MQAARTVYIVDDDQTIRQALTSVLTEAGFRPQAFASAEDFLKDCPADINHPCCFLIDLELPGMKGSELQDELFRRGIELPVVMISGQADVNTAVHVMRAGAVDLLQKPFSTATLIRRLTESFAKQDEWIAARKRRDEVQSLLVTLSPRERDVVDEVLAGRTNKQISAALQIGMPTVSRHKSSILKKLNVRNDLELILLLAGDGGRKVVQGRPDVDGQGAAGKRFDQQRRDGR